MKEPKPGAQGVRRFYKDVTVEPRDGGFAILLDGKPVKTPAGRALASPTRALADGVAAEWRAQGERVQPHTMALTQMLNTALDRMGTGPAHDETVTEIAAYALTDLVCFRATEPASLVARQSAQWQPMIEWLAERLGVRLAITTGFSPPAQKPAALSCIRAAVESCDPLRLAGLHAATAALGSVVLALALAEGRLDAEAAFNAGLLDDLHQLETWGEDEEARARLERIRADIAAAAEFLRLSRG